MHRFTAITRKCGLGSGLLNQYLVAGVLAISIIIGPAVTERIS